MSIIRRCFNDACSIKIKGEYDGESESCKKCAYNIEEIIEEKPGKDNRFVILSITAAVFIIGLIVFLALKAVYFQKADENGAFDGNSNLKSDTVKNAASKKNVDTILRIHGSDSIGLKLMPLLVEGYFASKGAEDISSIPISSDEILITFKLPGKPTLQAVELNCKGSDSAFEGLLKGACDIGMSSRRIRESELDKFHKIGLGDMSAFNAENIIALDAIAVIVNNSNSITSLKKSDVASIYRGQITDWSQVGGKPGKIVVCSMNQSSESYEAFKSMVLENGEFSKSIKVFSDKRTLSDEVAKDKNAIGFVDISSIGRARPIAISDDMNNPFALTSLNITTEDYPLTRRLYLYCSSRQNNSFNRELIDFALSEEGQSLIIKADLTSNNIKAETSKGVTLTQWERNDLRDKYMNIVDTSEARLSVNFRFNMGDSALDNKALKDIERIVRFLNRSKYINHRIILVGFADNIGFYEHNIALSVERANHVKEKFIELDPNMESRIQVEGFGKEHPIVANDTEEGRNKNRRVEVWLINNGN